MKDQLTGALERREFIELLHESVDIANEEKSSLALLVVDIRRFTRINRLYGYGVGDLVLQQLAKNLDEVARTQDHVARIGNDQFALLLLDVMNVEHVRMAAFKLLRLTQAPVNAVGQIIKYDVNIGVGICPQHSSDPEGLLRVAEEALLQVKKSDQALGIAESHEQVEISEYWDIEVELENAINRAQLLVYFQPKISLETGKPIGAEALVRWESPERGVVSPGVFMPIAETIGFIKPLTIWMLNSALRLSADWTRKWGELEVSVNIPPYFFSQPDFIDTIESVQKLWDAQNSRLCLEVLEQSFVGDVEASFATLHALKKMGVSIAIDDFGTGYSSLAYFRDIPADELKIDKSFVDSLIEDKANANIVELIIDLAHRFDLRVVAEGVEDIKTLVALKKMNCDVVQGYFFSKPLPAREFKDWLERFKGVKFTRGGSQV